MRRISKTFSGKQSQTYIFKGKGLKVSMSIFVPNGRSETFKEELLKFKELFKMSEETDTETATNEEMKKLEAWQEFVENIKEKWSLDGKIEVTEVDFVLKEVSNISILEKMSSFSRITSAGSPKSKEGRDLEGGEGFPKGGDAKTGLKNCFFFGLGVCVVFIFALNCENVRWQ